MSTTPAREKLHAFHASHPDIQNADGEQLLVLPPALLDEHDTLLAAVVNNPQNIQPGDRVSLAVSECPDTVTGGVVRVYRDAIGILVADIATSNDVLHQNVEFLTRVGSGFEPSYNQIVISLGREWRATSVKGRVPESVFAKVIGELHAAADRAGVSKGVAGSDLYDEING